MALYQYTVATMSWIDPRMHLPEEDDAGDPGPGCMRTRLLGQTAYRFANVLEGFVVVEPDSQWILTYGFSPVSGNYRAPSFLGISSDPFAMIQRAVNRGQQVVFRQIVGARTVSPERIGQFLLGSQGRQLVHWASGFPPIWTELELVIHANGAWAGRVIRHSLFPSMTYVEQERTLSTISLRVPTMTVPRRPVTRPATAGEVFVASSPYDGRPNYDNWQQNGWGPIPSTAGGSGPTSGNPWGFQSSASDDLDRGMSTGH